MPRYLETVVCKEGSCLSKNRSTPYLVSQALINDVLCVGDGQQLSLSRRHGPASQPAGQPARGPCWNHQRKNAACGALAARMNKVHQITIFLRAPCP